MIKNIAPRLWIVLLFTAGCIACSATSAPVSFYSLSALCPPNRHSSQATAPSIGVGPVILPGYLNRPQMITRTGANQMHIDEYHRWAGDLEQDMVRVLTENLMVLLGPDRIAPIPWPSDFNPDITVRLEVFAFEGSTDGTVHLRASISIADRRAAGAARMWTVDLTQQTPKHGYDAMVAAQSQLLADLSRQIAEAITGR
ncbi:MAG: PqiC family protein [Desulfobacteraceae bacterium]|nr:PqiC family protein [Desulfobacteraceae bacterium]